MIWGSIITAGLLFTGCHSNNNDAPAKLSYKVTLKNVTYAQPMSPMAVAYHSDTYKVFEVGKSASVGLEKLAEDGDNSTLLSELASNLNVQTSIGGNGLIVPSKNDSVTLEGESQKCISVVTMLVNTNDAFAGIDCVDVSAMKVGEKMMIGLVTYDAGTEANSELASTIPGPAGGGEGFNAARDDKDFVSVHAGVVTKDDGLSTSALTQMHKWDNPAASVSIERVK